MEKILESLSCSSSDVKGLKGFVCTDLNGLCVAGFAIIF